MLSFQSQVGRHVAKESSVPQSIHRLESNRKPGTLAVRKSGDQKVPYGTAQMEMQW